MIPSRLKLRPFLASLYKSRLTSPRLNKSRAHRVLWLLEELNVNYDLKVYKRGDDMVSDLVTQFQ